jgi:hypothetical protein
LITIFAIALSLIAIPTTSAQSSKSTYAYIGAVPNPVGVNQETVIHFGITENLPNATDAFTGLTVKVTKPDTTVETLGPFSTDSMGGASTVYVPTTAGDYSLQATFPSQTVSGGTYLASSSRVITLVVQAEPVTYNPALPLSPDYYSASYYSWPVDDQLTNWQQAYMESYFDGPSSAHVRWVYQFRFGGVVGGQPWMVMNNPNELNQMAFDMGDAYSGTWSTRSIVGGIGYWSWNAPTTHQSPTLLVASDLRTGEELWRSTTLGGSPFEQVRITKYGINRYLWRSVSGSAGGNAGTVWSAYDPYTLQWCFNYTNMPSGTRIQGYPNGEFCLYTVSTTGDYMTWWNETDFRDLPGVFDALNVYRTVNVSSYGSLGGFTANYTIPDCPGSVREYRWGDRIIGTYESSYTTNDGGNTTAWAFSLTPESDGKTLPLIYNTTVTGYKIANVTDGPSTSFSWRLFGDSAYDSAHVHANSITMRYWAYSYGTGEELWKSEDFNLTGGWGGETYQDHFSGTSSTTGRQVGYNRYQTGIGGRVYCYNATHGVIWVYTAKDPYTEFQWSDAWWLGTPFATMVGPHGQPDKIYFGTLEHSPNQPLPRGGPFICLNATTGEVIWRINGMFRQTGWGGQPLMEAGIILTQDSYDERTYCIGKGPTSTTVTAPDEHVPSGSAAIIRGTVMDISPGCSATQIKLRFPYGVPAVSDESMSDWMLYVYKDFTRPADAVGVNVVITVLDSSNNVVETGQVTSDANGVFSYDFVPDKAGEYSAVASYAGSNSYYGSFAVSNAFAVEEAPAATPTPEPTPVPMSEAYFVPAIVGIIVAIIIVGLLLALLLLRKH